VSLVTASDNVAVHSTVGPDDVAAAVAAAKEERYNQRFLYRQLRHRNSAEYWARKIDTDQVDPWSLWGPDDSQLQEGIGINLYRCMLNTT